MAIDLDPVLPRPASAPARLLRIAGIPLLLLAEMLALSFHCDGRDVFGTQPWAIAVAGRLSASCQVGITVLTVGALLLGRRLWDWLSRLGDRPADLDERWPWLVA